MESLREFLKINESIDNKEIDDLANTYNQLIDKRRKNDARGIHSDIKDLLKDLINKGIDIGSRDAERKAEKERVKQGRLPIHKRLVDDR